MRHNRTQNMNNGGSDLQQMIDRGKEFKFRTRNTLPEKVRSGIENMLQDRLADSLDLVTQLKHAHWNVKGPSFIGLHKLFDEIYEESLEYVDLIAERIVQLGGIAEGTIRVSAARSSLPEYPLILTTGLEHIEAVSRVMSVYGELIRQAIKQAEGMGDDATADIFVEILRGVDKHLWFVEAHEQSDK